MLKNLHPFKDVLAPKGLYIEAAPVLKGNKCWILSQADQDSHSLDAPKTFSERLLHQKLTEQGWTVYVSGSHPLIEEIQYLSSFETVASFSPSFLFPVLFLKNLQSELILFDLNLPGSESKEDMESLIQEYVSENSACFQRIPLDVNSPGRLLPNLSGVLNHLDIPISACNTPADDNAYVHRINQLATLVGAKRYLEIGVQYGATFLQVDIPNKIGVDLDFLFDIRCFETDQVYFFQLPSDEFFTHYSAEYSKEKRFDIIFIDGLHQFEQVLRDFMNSLTVAHDDTIWVIDDTVPCDVFSALRTQKETMDLREKATGHYSAFWHGDVFKFVFVLHNFFPMFDYFTTHQDAANQQTIVWRSKRGFVKPICANLSQITQLTYLDVLKNPDVFQYKMFEEGLLQLNTFFENKKSYSPS